MDQQQARTDCENGMELGFLERTKAINRLCILTGQFLVSIGVVLPASRPLAVLAIDNGFGFSVILLVPTCCVSLWLALSSPRRSQRIGWFAFFSVVTLLLPSGNWWQRRIEDTLTWTQDLIRESAYDSLYSSAEVVAIFTVFLLPWVVACLSGWLVARFVRRKLGLSNSDPESSSDRTYRFSLRGMLISYLVCGILASWISSTVRGWQTKEETNRDRFLQQFSQTFTTGNVTLLTKPEITENNALTKTPSFRGLGSSEYRIIASIKKKEREIWGVWAFLCNEDYPDTVSKFGYAEARTKERLPEYPFPRTKYLSEPKSISQMRDGEPELHQAEFLDAPSTAKPGDTISITVKTERFFECELIIRPITAVTTLPVIKNASESGIVTWDIVIGPKYRGASIEYECQTRTNTLYRTRAIVGTMEIRDRKATN